ncbi:hypothetical protein GCM10009661_29580 [Catellatospora chokoriensis]|uniref:Uncharacterized protein n=1 Tax=Catellatospora chokoriensis TaxID=310353 RepID=A0A8J3JWN6_9ACTN|nr:hypothetical protein Cch02nite_32930 [Catellatospora chokoriensis]
MCYVLHQGHLCRGLEHSEVATCPRESLSQRAEQKTKLAAVAPADCLPQRYKVFGGPHLRNGARDVQRAVRHIAGLDEKLVHGGHSTADPRHPWHLRTVDFASRSAYAKEGAPGGQAKHYAAGRLPIETGDGSIDR